MLLKIFNVIGMLILLSIIYMISNNLLLSCIVWLTVVPILYLAIHIVKDKNRITNGAFYNCPLCGKKPHWHFGDVDVMGCYCEGTWLHKHKLLDTGMLCGSPHHVYEKMLDKWNSIVYDYDIYNNGV